MYAQRLCIPVLAALIGLPAAALAQAPKLGVVDVQKVMEATPEWMQAVETLRRELDKRKAKLEGEQEALKKKKEQLEAKRTMGDPKKIADEEAQLLEDAKKFTQAFMAAQQDLTRQEGALKDAMLSRVERIVMQLADEGEYTYIFESGTPGNPNVLYAKAGLDLTPRVLELYKKHFAGKPLEAPPGPSATKSPGTKGP